VTSHSLRHAPATAPTDSSGRPGSGSRSPLAIALTCAGIAIATSAIAVAPNLAAQDWRLSALVRMSPVEPMAALARKADPSFAFVSPDGHYDGVYFYAIVRDPLALGEEHLLIDRPGYRYGHAGFGWLAWLASGGGHPSAIPAALLALNLLGIAAAAVGASLLAREFGWSGWGGLAVSLNPGLVYAVSVDTGEPVGVAIMTFALLAWKRARLGLAAVGFVALCLMKEPYVLVPAGVAAFEGIQWFRNRRPAKLIKKAAVLAVGPIAFGLWYFYLRTRFGHWPFTEAHDIVSLPIVGWIDTFRQAAEKGLGPHDQMQLGAGAIPILAVVAVAFLLGLWRAIRMRTWLDTVFLLYIVLISMLNWLALLYPKDLPRELSVPLLLLPAVLATPRAQRTDVPAG
jgi:hypothetical protein